MTTGHQCSNQGLDIKTDNQTLNSPISANFRLSGQFFDFWHRSWFGSLIMQWQRAISVQTKVWTSTLTTKLKTWPFFQIPDRQAIFFISDSKRVTHKMAWRSEICRYGCVLSLVVSVYAQTLVWTLMARCHCIRSVPNQDLLVWVPVLLSEIKKMAWRSEICRNGWVWSLVVSFDVQTLDWTLMARCHCIRSLPNPDLSVYELLDYCQKSKKWPDGLEF